MTLAAEQFYSLRDSRTDLYSEAHGYSLREVTLSIDEFEARTLPGQVAYLLATNLAARWCRSIRLICPEVQLLSSLSNLSTLASPVLQDVALAIAREADPFGSFEATRLPTHGSIHLHVGERRPPGAFGVFGRGWLAFGSIDQPRLGLEPNENPLGAMLAACLGVAWTFRAALDDKDLPKSICLSLYNLRGGSLACDGPAFPNTSVGNVLLVGCGAVGSALVFLMPIARVTGVVTLVDRDTVEVSNLNRSPLFTMAHIGGPKVRISAKYLRTWGYQVDEIEKWFDEALEAGQAFTVRPDLVIPTANDRNVRHLIQHQVPPLQIHGTTGRNWDSFLGRHIPLTEDCLACRFPNAKNNGSPALSCGTGQVDTRFQDSGGGQEAALPFLSTASAVLAVAEVVKTSLEGFPIQGNYACLDFRGAMNDIMVVQRTAARSCACSNQSSAWRQLNGRTLHSRFSIHGVEGVQGV